ncbi:unnamed protein product [Heligmosomoides polygyrus]|uniref:Laminin G domain-containing protein n=1 Tax=Heligmosomoides polygyrus TaxID=6339 RepID=A0A3P7TCN6_HELPZ|nr:unnamed protein product [Heligmosomoides polygyrus]
MVFFWRTPPDEQQSKDYIAMLLVDAQLQLLWSIGSFTNFIRTPSILPRAVWNAVRFELSPSEAAIYVNGSADVASSFAEATDQLQFQGGPVFLGGVSAEQTIPEELQKFEMKFVGAVKRLEMDEIPFNLHRVSWSFLLTSLAAALYRKPESGEDGLFITIIRPISNSFRVLFEWHNPFTCLF